MDAIGVYVCVMLNCHQKSSDTGSVVLGKNPNAMNIHRFQEVHFNCQKPHDIIPVFDEHRWHCVSIFHILNQTFLDTEPLGQCPKDRFTNRTAVCGWRID